MIRRSEAIKKIDKFIGRKIYELRLYKGLSRRELSKRVGVSTVQLLKYEQASNSITAGRLVLIAKALENTIDYFDYASEQVENGTITLTQHQRMCLEISRNFMRIRSFQRREAVNILIQTLAVP